MKQLLLLVLLLANSLSYAQNGKSVSDEDRLNKYITSHISYFTFNGQRPEGKGWDTLDSLFAKNQFVAWGEYHNSPLLSQLTVYALESAAKYGYKNWCVEVGPYTATELTRISRATNPADTIEKLFKEGYPKIGTFPFFSTANDAQMLMAAHKFGYHIWGIDQEFQMSFPYGLKKIYQAQSNKFRQRYKPLYDSLQAKWWYPNTLLLDSLANAIGQKQYKALLQGIKVSKEIYRNGDNASRAALMKKNFFWCYNQTDNKQKVFFKMGSNHLAKGMNLQTNLYDIGNAVYELAQRNQTGFANVYLMVRYTIENGKLTDDFSSKENENPRVFSSLYEKDKWVLIDLRKLKVKYDATLSRDTYQLIEKYDYVLISPEILHADATEN
ncbi:hypothetical protein MUY27_05200 [Mucilaginibacter sp. RS28]|uniref:Erythromycin esterase n=1 Tax=Mucilaginibacter straminoryzae TaxID=2932774 RepID=A0A9X1X319_9SPHI|nr:hypothetical protein [Mucilaginibacter straminoryzae]MCJ8209095.1 hypothetical protein [Mucilaginibacter straminoryzae]